jgi:hypothetical protein
MSLQAIVRNYISYCRPGAQAELDWFRQQPTLEAAVTLAAHAINNKGKRFPHQHRITKDALEKARQSLMTNSSGISQVHSFDDLFILLTEILKPIHGIGDLYIYDTSLRIGAKLGVLPQKVYLHAGTLIGAGKLGLPIGAEVLELKAIPPEFQPLEPHEIEDVLCIFKDDFEVEDMDELRDRSWCNWQKYEKT